MIKGMLIDVDGTLVLSNNAHAYAWVDAFGEAGYSVKFDVVRPLMGMGSDKLIPKLYPELSAEQGKGESIAKRRREIFLNKYLPQIEPAPGGEELIKKLHKCGIKTVVASSASSTELESLLAVANVTDLLTKQTSSSDVDNSKPDPDIIAAALKKIDLPAKQVLLIGDTPYDIESAEICDVSVIAVRCGGFSDIDLHGAWKIYDSPADVSNHLNDILSQG
jgi:HAD superfamily hydrolase (TIGR01509 family)